MKPVVEGIKIFLVVMILLKLTLPVDTFQKGSTTIFAIKFNETESEDSQKTSADEADEFVEESFEWNRLNLSHQIISLPRHAVEAEAHIREIIPPPPQV